MGDERKSIRSSLEDRKVVRASDLKRRDLFQTVDVDGSGLIDIEEFDKLYEVLREQAQRDVSLNVNLEHKVAKSKRRLKMTGCFGLLMMTFLGMSVIANFTVTSMLLEVTVCSHLLPLIRSHVTAVISDTCFSVLQ